MRGAGPQDSRCGNCCPFSSHSTGTETETLRHTKNVCFCQSDQKIGIILIQLQKMIIVITYHFGSKGTF